MQRAGIMVRTRCVSPPRPEHACCSHSQHLRPTANISQQWFLEDFSSASHVTIKTSPACTIIDGLLLWRGWEIIFRMRRESTALVLLLAGVTSQVWLIFGVLYFNTNSEFQCHTKKERDIMCKGKAFEMSILSMLLQNGIGMPKHAYSLNWDIFIIRFWRILPLLFGPTHKLSFCKLPFKKY